MKLTTSTTIRAGLGVAAIALVAAGCSSSNNDNQSSEATSGSGGSGGDVTAPGSGGSDVGGAATGGTTASGGGAAGDASMDGGVAAAGGDPSLGGYPASVCDGRDDPYVAGMTKEGALGTGMTVSLMDANPAPPQMCDDCNSWTVMIKDGDGNPIEGADIDVEPRMPDHNHGTPIEVIPEDMGGGEYQLDSISLFMKGYWTIKVTVTPPDSDKDNVTFKFCVPPGSS